ncbi:uncharacterized protein LMH87_007695 [Akanthomyces muscarius]|uniref:Uncharacterized protein n=1 Tax=Akanthomyces muscarius TaxID=2231603 RepID=A0A9W8QKN7_AKAMU|nr:uncharacterized protein LMH87_007695 [Akanthomyces muscarius]KAJ4161669.1 hypothetical protein LMH87_007695 [Akanthomyces muscarius]
MTPKLPHFVSFWRYLFEVNALDELEDVCTVTLLAAKALIDEERATNITASTLSIQASMCESTSNVEKAIELNMKGYEMRLAENPIKGGLLGGFEQNLAYNFNTANQHKEAVEWFNKSKKRWIAWNVQEGRAADRPTVTKKNTARCLFYLGRYREAESLVKVSKTEFRNEKVLNWAMLAYAYFVHGTIQQKTDRLEAASASFVEAQKLWMGGDQTRLHPFPAGCIYKTGVVYLALGKIEVAINRLREALAITKFHADRMPAEHARRLSKLSEALLQGSCDDDGKAKDLRDEAEVFLVRRDPAETDFGREESYNSLVPIFWR